MEIDLLIVPTELGKLLGVSKARTYAMIREGKLPKPKQFGGVRAYRLRDALELVALRRVNEMASGRRPARVIVNSARTAA